MVLLSRPSDRIHSVGKKSIQFKRVSDAFLGLYDYLLGEWFCAKQLEVKREGVGKPEM